MKRFLIFLALSTFAAGATAGFFKDLQKQFQQSSSSGSATAVSQLADSEIVQGLRDALAKGTKNAILQLGKTDGFWKDPRFQIPLPSTVIKADTFLRAAGYGPKIDELHLSFNRAAEKAVPVAADVFSGAVQKLTLADARNILQGPPDAATQYFRRTTEATLQAQFKPIVAQVTSQAGLVQQYAAVMKSAGPLASALTGGTDVNDYVTRKALDGLFLRVADEEKSIRANPAARTTDVLKRVFGAASK